MKRQRLGLETCIGILRRKHEGNKIVVGKDITEMTIGINSLLCLVIINILFKF